MKQRKEHCEIMLILLDPIQLLLGPKQGLSEDCVLIKDKYIVAFGEKARHKAKELGIKATFAKSKIIAPCLVDPHSTLEEPFTSSYQTLDSLMKEAAMSGYGQIALLPKSSSWRDRPDRLLSLAQINKDIQIHLWGSFSHEGKGQELSPHYDLMNLGAVGLAEGDTMPPTKLLKKGFILGEMSDAPVLIAPRDKELQGSGIAREGVEALRTGLPSDPLASEVIPLKILMTLQEQHPEINLRLMNISTAKSVSMLANSSKRPLSSVSWWHLIADSSSLHPTSIGWNVSPSLGNSKDRGELIKGLREKTITGVAVHAIPLDQTEIMKPIGERIPGLSGHRLVLPSLWEELIVKRKWTVEELWEAISFGPSRILNRPPEKLAEGSNRWLLYNPEKRWTHISIQPNMISPANYPWTKKEMLGGIEDCGLIE